MATYYVVCINKHPTHQDPHNRIQRIGTSTSPSETTASKVWELADVIRAIEAGDVFWSTDARGDRVQCIVAIHQGHKYVKTKNDGIHADNLLAKRECRS
jgi:hypothetical protein